MNEVFNKYCIYLKYLMQVACAEQGLDFDSKFKELSSPAAKPAPKPAPQAKKQNQEVVEQAKKREEEQRYAQQQREREKAEQLRREAQEAERIKKEKEEKLREEQLRKEQKLADYINALVQELAAGKKKVYKKTLQEKATAAGKDGGQVVKDVQDFVALFNASVEDRVITKLEKASLINMGRFAMVTPETIEKMLEPYSNQKITMASTPKVIVNDDPIPETATKEEPKPAVKDKPKPAAKNDPKMSSLEQGDVYYEQEDYGQAMECYRKAAEEGDADAQCDLGYCYKIGDGVKKDPKKAVEWFTKSAEQGNARAQYNLALCFEHGNGVKKNLKKAIEWYTKSAEQGYESAQCNLKLLK